MEKTGSMLNIFFLGHMWLTGKDIRGAATKISNSEVHIAGKEIVATIKLHYL
jgi:hypothetical protein